MKEFLSHWMVNSKVQNRSKASDQLVLFERQITYRSSVCLRVKLILNLKIVIIFEPLEI